MFTLGTKRPGHRLSFILVIAGSAGALSCGWECADIARDYRRAVAAARNCDPAAMDPCAGSQLAALDVATCPLAVNPAAVPGLETLIARYRDRGCGMPPALPCPLPPPAVCKANASGVTVCQ